jgi:hypothetical protein
MDQSAVVTLVEKVELNPLAVLAERDTALLRCLEILALAVLLMFITVRQVVAAGMAEAEERLWVAVEDPLTHHQHWHQELRILKDFAQEMDLLFLRIRVLCQSSPHQSKEMHQAFKKVNQFKSQAM